MHKILIAILLTAGFCLLISGALIGRTGLTILGDVCIALGVLTYIYCRIRGPR